MSVQVSYKKQFMLGIIGLLIIFLIFEGGLRIYDYYHPNCRFLKSEVFENVDFDLKRSICLDHGNLKYTGDPFLQNIPNQQLNTISINSYGFRGPEIEQEKNSDTFRIFQIGGSTTFGAGTTSDDTTIPGHLQKLFDSSEFSFPVEVINAGVLSSYSYHEALSVKNNLINFKPDLFIIYDGWNDFERQYEFFEKPLNTSANDKIMHFVTQNPFFKSGDIFLKNWFVWRAPDGYQHSYSDPYIDEKVELWKQQWSEICTLGQTKNFDVVVVLQPFAGTGNKILTEQEKYYSELRDIENSLSNYDKYGMALKDLKNVCLETIDLRNALDDETETVYYDFVHLGDYGNKIIAKKIYEKISPLIQKIN